MTNEEFKIESMKDYTFRVKKMSPIDVLAISTQINFESFKMTKTLMTFCIENVEVKIGEKWLPVKVQDKEIYQPAEIVNKYTALNELFTYMMEKITKEVFPSSSESK